MKQFGLYAVRVGEMTVHLFAKGEEASVLFQTVNWLVLALAGASLIDDRHLHESLRYVASAWLLFLLFVYAPYRVWLKDSKRADNAEAQLRPRLKCSFDKSHGCQHKTKLQARAPIPGTGMQVVASSRVRFFRVRIEAEGIGVIKDCSGHLLSLKRNGRTLFDHDSITLPIAPAERENPTVKDIRAGVPEYLDVFLLMDTNHVKITSPGFLLPISLDANTLFSGPGEYTFHVVVSAPESPPVPVDIVLKWTGDWETAEAYAG